MTGKIGEAEGGGCSARVQISDIPNILFYADREYNLSEVNE